MNNSTWIYLSFFVTFITTVSVITMKYLTNSTCNVATLTFITFLLSALIVLIYIPFDKTIIYDIKNLTKKDFYLIFFYCFVLIISRLAQVYLFKITPKIGISHLIINSNIIFTLFASYILFKQNINCKSLIGVFITLFGLSITLYYSN